MSISNSKSINNIPRLPTVGVVIPSYNHDKYIIRALDSVAMQNYPHKHIVVVDDSSTDNTRQILQQHIINDTYKNISTTVLYNKQNSGPSFTRNRGIKEIWDKVDIFAFLDADDYYLQHKLSLSIQALLMDMQNIGFVYSDNYIHNEFRNLTIHEFRQPYNSETLQHTCLPSPSTIVNKLALKEHGLFNEQLRTCEDFDLWIRISKTYAGFHIPIPLNVINVTPYNSTITVDKKTWEENYKYVTRMNR